MVNWIATEAVTLLCLLAGFWRSFKLLKDGIVDFSILEFWAVMGVVELAEWSFEWIISWVPFYWTFKALAMLTLCYPRSRVAGVLFDALVIPFMRFCHELLSEKHLEEKIVGRLLMIPFLAIEMVVPGSVLGEPDGGGGDGGDGGDDGNAEPKRSMPYVHSDDSIAGGGARDDDRDEGKLAAKAAAKGSDDHSLSPPKKATAAAAGPHSPPKDGHSRITSVDMSRLVSSHNRLQRIAAHHTPERRGASSRSASRSISRSPLHRRSPSPMLTPTPKEEEDASPSLTGVPYRKKLNVTLRRRQSRRSDCEGKSDKASPGGTGGGARGGEHHRRMSWGRRGMPVRASPPKAKDEKKTKDEKKKKKKKRKTSLGTNIRELLTGDDRVRIRDHLFDISTASPPPRVSFGSPSSPEAKKLSKASRTRRRMSEMFSRSARKTSL